MLLLLNNVIVYWVLGFEGFSNKENLIEPKLLLKLLSSKKLIDLNDEEKKNNFVLQKIHKNN